MAKTNAAKDVDSDKERIQSYLQKYCLKSDDKKRYINETIENCKQYENPAELETILKRNNALNPNGIVHTFKDIDKRRKDLKAVVKEAMKKRTDLKSDKVVTETIISSLVSIIQQENNFNTRTNSG